MSSFVPLDELLGGSVLGVVQLTLPGYSTPQTAVVPVVGGTVDVYQRGTTTHVACFVDQHGAGSPVAQPLTTNSTGQVVDGSGNRVFTAQPAELDVHVSGGGLSAPRTIPVGELAGAAGAPLDSPVFTGTPTAPTPSAADASTKLATTAFVRGALGALALTNVVSDTPEAHGAKRDGIVLTDVAMTNGSGVVNSPSGRFVSTDVGKAWLGAIVGPGGAGKILVSRIASYQSPTRVTLADPATNTPGGPVVAVYGTDDTAAINAATSSVVALGQATNAYYGEVIFSGGIYVVAGPLDNTQHGYSQIPLPYQPPDGMKFTLVFKGTRDNSGLTHWSQPEPQMTGAVLVSALYPAYSPTFGIPSCIGGPTSEQGYGNGNNGIFSNMLFVLDGVTVTLPFDHTQHGVNAFAMAECNVPNLGCFSLGTVNGGYWWPNFLPTQGFYYSGLFPACGLVMPNVGNNDNCNIGLYSAEGLTAGIALGEHTHADSIRVISSDIGVTFTTGTNGVPGNDHSMDIDYLSTEACRIHIYVPAVGSFPQILNIANWDPEDGLASYHIYDADPGALRGEIRMNTAMCSQKPLIIHGGAHIIDTSKHPGFPDTQPAVPAASTNFRNDFWRDAFVDITGGAGVSVTVDGVPWSASKTVPVGSGKSINLGAYTTAPAWRWMLM